MQLSKKIIDDSTEQEINHLLFQLLSDLKNPQEAKKLVNGILTPAEVTTIAKRLAIAHFLKQGQSYEKIREQLKVSSATIASVQTKLSEPNGYSMALEKIHADQWANKWAKRITNLLRLP